MATYSPSIEFAQPQAIEMAVKSTRARRNRVFRPKMWLNLASIMRKPIEIKRSCRLIDELNSMYQCM